MLKLEKYDYGFYLFEDKKCYGYIHEQIAGTNDYWIVREHGNPKWTDLMRVNISNIKTKINLSEDSRLFN